MITIKATRAGTGWEANTSYAHALVFSACCSTAGRGENAPSARHAKPPYAGSMCRAVEAGARGCAV